jgi:sterol desaturase/sphingolipid hydroxylase (fatty acid hydroxylase superfamily)
VNDQVHRKIIDKAASSWFQYWSGHVANYTIVIWFTSRAYFHKMPISAWFAPFLFGLGLFIWTFAEYAFHRWLYHGPLKIAHVGHGMHHEDPTGPIAMPWYLNISGLLLIYFLFSWVMGPPIAGLLMGGFWFGHVLYTIIHYIIHKWSFPKNKLYMKHWRHHQVHHQMDQVNLGVTTLLWDRLLGTLR